MNKKTTKVIVIAIVVVAVAAAVWYLLKGKKDSDVVTVETSKDDTIVKYINGIGYLFDGIGNFVGKIKEGKSSKKKNKGGDDVPVPEVEDIDWNEEETNDW